MASLTTRASAAGIQNPQPAKLKSRGRRDGAAQRRRQQQRMAANNAGRALFNSVSALRGPGRAKELKAEKDIVRPRLAVLTANRVTKVAT